MTQLSRTKAKEQRGSIVRVDRYGLAMVKAQRNGKIYPFTFDKISGYGGQFPEEIGLLSGAKVSFTSIEGKIDTVEILEPALLAAKRNFDIKSRWSLSGALTKSVRRTGVNAMVSSVGSRIRAIGSAASMRNVAPKIRDQKLRKDQA